MRSSGTPGVARRLVRAQQHARRPGRRRCWRTCASGTGSTPCGCRARRCGSLRPCTRCATTRAGSSAATAAKRDHSSLTCRWCSSTRATGVGAQRGLEQRVHHASARPRGAPSRTSLEPGRSSPITHAHGASSPVVPVELDAGLATRPPAGVHALGAADQHDVALAALDRVRELVDEQLRAVAADGRDRGRRGARCRAAGEERARVGVAPRDDLRRPRRCRRVEQRRAPRVALGERGRVGEQVDRRARRRSAGTRCDVWPTPTMTGRAGISHESRTLRGQSRLDRRLGASTGHAGSPGAALSRQIER